MPAESIPSVPQRSPIHLHLILTLRNQSTRQVGPAGVFGSFEVCALLFKLRRGADENCRLIWNDASILARALR